MNEYPFPPFAPMPGLWSPLQQTNPYTPTALNSIGLDALPRMVTDQIETPSSDDLRPETVTKIQAPPPPSMKKRITPPQKGIHLNYDHIFASNVIGAFGQFLGNNNENSYQNAALRFNKEQFNPLNYLPENPNVSKQALYGLDEFSEGGTYDLSDAQIQHLISQGYEIEKL